MIDDNTYPGWEEHCATPPKQVVTEIQYRGKTYREGSWRLRLLIFARDNFTCMYCGKKPPRVELQLEHIKPRSKGGKSSPDNLATACVQCNLAKSDKEIDAVTEQGMRAVTDTRLAFTPDGCNCGDYLFCWRDVT